MLRSHSCVALSPVTAIVIISTRTGGQKAINSTIIPGLCDRTSQGQLPCNLMMPSSDCRVFQRRGYPYVRLTAPAGSGKAPSQSFGTRSDLRSDLTVYPLSCHEETQVVRLAPWDLVPFPAAVILAVRIDAVKKVAGVSAPVADRLTVERIERHVFQILGPEFFQLPGELSVASRYRSMAKAVFARSRCAGRRSSSPTRVMAGVVILVITCRKESRRILFSISPSRASRSGGGSRTGFDVIRHEVQRVAQPRCLQARNHPHRRALAGLREQRRIPARLDHETALGDHRLCEVESAAGSCQGVAQLPQLRIREGGPAQAAASSPPRATPIQAIRTRWLIGASSFSRESPTRNPSLMQARAASASPSVRVISRGDIEQLRMYLAAWACDVIWS